VSSVVRRHCTDSFIRIQLLVVFADMYISAKELAGRDVI
jgi:hypothetical protein